MNNQFLKVEIGAENQQQADTILNSLLAKKLVTSGLFVRSAGRFWWKGEIVDMPYVIIHCHTVVQNKEAIMADVRTTSVEEVPEIVFIPFDGNSELLGWIEDTLKNKK